MGREPDISIPRWRRLGPWAAAAVIVLATLAAYHNCLDGEFLFDDENGIVLNPHIQSLTPLTRALSAPPQISVSGRPLVCLSLAVNYHFGRYNVRGYHAFNLAVHVLAALALFGVVRRTLRLGPLAGRFGRAAGPLACLVALVWAVHPIQTECVSYVVQRSESMVGLSYLLTLYLVIRGLEIEHAAAGRGLQTPLSAVRWLWYGLAVAACALGMLCKEVMATAPLIVLLYDRIFAADSFRQLLRRRWPLYALLAATWVILALLVQSGPRSETAGFGVANLISPWQYAATQVGVVAHYLRLAFWPDDLILQIDWPVARSAGDVLWPALVVGPLLAGTLWGLVRGLRKRGLSTFPASAEMDLAGRKIPPRHSAQQAEGKVECPLFPAAGFLGAWFFIILAPSSSFVPIVTEVMAEHRMYLPLAAVVALVVIGGYALADGLLARARASGLMRIAAGGIGAALALAVGAALGWATVQRNGDYRTELAMWQDVERKCPRSTWSAVNIGKALYYQGRLEEARVWYERALARDPTNGKAHYDMGVWLARAGQAQAAIGHYDKAIECSPSLAEAYQNLGVLYANLGQMDQAERAYRAGLEKRPQYAELHNGLGTVLFYKGDAAGAVACFRRALELDPNLENADFNLVAVLEARGDYPGAVAHGRHILAGRPDNVRGLTKLAMLLAACKADGIRNGPEALALARRAATLCEAGPGPHGQDLTVLEALAAAQAECGQFDQAAATVQSGIAQAQARGDAKALAAFQSQLALYQSGKALRM